VTSGGPGAAVLKALEDLLTALRKSSKDLAFYPPGHPLLNRSLERSAEQLRAVVAARAPLTLGVSRAGFSYEGQPVAKENRQLATMAAELFVRRIQKIYFALDIGSEELASFLRMITSDPKQLVQQGGPAKVLTAHGVVRIQVNEFDFRRASAAAGAGEGEAGRTEGAGSDQGAGPGKGETGELAAAELTGGQTTGLQGAEETPASGDAAGSGGEEAAKAEEQAEVTAESLMASLGSKKELTVEALIQRLEQEGASGGTAGYEWAASRLEKAIGQAIHDDWLQDVLAILRVFLRHRRDENLKTSLRERAAQAVETVSGGNTAAYLIAHLRTEERESARDLSAVLVGLGSRVIAPLLGRLAAEDQEEARERLAATLVRFHEAAAPHLMQALQALEPDQACHLAPTFGEVGGEAGVALLASLFRHRDARVRGETVRELGRVNEVAAQRLVVQALRDPDPAVFEVAVGLVAEAKLKLAIPPLLRLAGQRALTGKAFAIRKTALAALGAMGEAGIIPMLRGVLFTRTWFQRAAGDELRRAAALALLATARPEAREMVEAGAHSRRGDVRRACSAALRAAPAAK